MYSGLKRSPHSNVPLARPLYAQIFPGGWATLCVRKRGCRTLWVLVLQRVRGLPLLFSRSPRIHSNHSARLTAVQPLFSTVRCKTLNIFIKVCYSLPCLPNTILACLLFPLLENSSRAGNGSALSDSLPPLFSSLPTTDCSLSTLPPSPIESYRLPTPTP